MPYLNLVILGGGNGAHCMAGLAATLPDVKVSVLTLYKKEAQRWSQALEKRHLQITVADWKPGKDRIFTSKPVIVTKNSAEVIPDADIIVFVVPAFAHDQYFSAIEPYLREGTVICGCPGGCGFMFQALHTLSEKARTCCLLSFESLPWTCRLTEFGHSATILAMKSVLHGGSMGNLQMKTVIGKTPQETLDYILLNRTKMKIVGHLLGDTLACSNTYTHPGLEYGRWRDWDGKPVSQTPDIYHSATQLGADTVQKVSDESLRIRDAVTRLRPDLDLSQVVGEYASLCNHYSDDVIPNKTNLYTIYRSCKGYNNIKHPMIKTEEGQYVPDFSHRYFTEDITYGLVVVKGIAEIVNVPTPAMDDIIVWAQERMNKEYLVGGKVVGKDIGETRCPQRYGITTLEGLLGG